MRRISRLRGPSGLRWSTSCRSIASLSSQCSVAKAPVSICSTTLTPSPVAAASSSRMYSTKPDSSTLPQSLGGAKTHVPQLDIEAANEDPHSAETEIIAQESWDMDAGEPNEYTSQTFQPPPPRSYAERTDEIRDPSYVPATTVEGLSTLGGLEGWWDRRENWPRSSDFQGFIEAKRKITHPDSLEVATRRALVEVLVRKARGQHLTEGMPVGGKEELLRALALDLKVKENGEISLVADDSAIELVAKDLDWENVLAKEELTGKVPAVPTLLPGEAQSFKEAAQWRARWKSASLSEPKLKFAVLKRIFQLTGQRVQDHQLPGITDVLSLLRTIKAPPKPKTLSQEIMERKQDLVQLPNVAFAPKRVTRGDKDIALGRFKIIEKELMTRDVNVHPLSVGKSREQKWLKGQS
ncbi:uncharacterized protein BCR38DRAFT_476284 [Pseudomassariella vexata]|uniref:Large ribosomal subunit protein mL50 n=1 Tax=Pseudomassariella vexata TaxID=1141098 RepID=A0A1Y2DR36_9PEZI|nr:uncharacterized protein BCR38DRAFT_476284 [Pseudomassariella vexata]ORY61566.1 hypothetical protein BCR38DRAFT_476284 [Pseudomassariella vexata]